MAFFNKWVDQTVIATLEHIIASDFAHLTYTEGRRGSWRSLARRSSSPWPGAGTSRANTNAT